LDFGRETEEKLQLNPEKKNKRRKSEQRREKKQSTNPKQ
jgi:hypothetical protein